MNKQISISNRFIGPILLGVALLGLYSISLSNYLFFHVLSELFSIIVACGIFLLAWNSKRFLDNGYLLVLGISMLFVASIDVVHTLLYKGMGVFPNIGSNIATQLWISARYMQSISFLIAPIFLTKKAKLSWLLPIYALVTGLIFSSILIWQIFPISYQEGVGLTPFKIYSEYIISLILAASLVLLVINRKHFPSDVVRFLYLSIAVSIASELAFTEYVSVYGDANMIGHLLKILAFYMVYRAIIETGFRRPVELLFHNLKMQEEELRKSHEELEEKVAERTRELTHYKEHLEELVDVRTDELQQEINERIRVEQALVESQERMKLATEAANIGTWDLDIQQNAFILSNEGKTILGIPVDSQVSQQTVLSIMHPDDRDRNIEAIRTAVESCGKYEAEYRIFWPNQTTRWIFSRGRCFADGEGKAARLVGISFDITQRKESEEQIRQNSIRASALAELSKTMASSRLDDRSVIERVSKYLSQVFGDLCLVRLVSADNQWLKLEAAAHPHPEARELAHQILENSRQRPDEGPSGRVIQSGEPIFVPVLKKELLESTLRPEFFPYYEKYGLSSLIMVPLHIQGAVMGTMTLIRSQTERPYTQEDLSLVQDVAERAAITITNGRLFRQLENELQFRKEADLVLKTYTSQLARSNRELQDFASIASHDLQEPLRKILAFGERLKVKYQSTLGAEGQDYLERMQNAASRMQIMLNDLLEYSRVTTKAQPLVPVDLNEVVEGVLSDLEIRIEETGGQVNVAKLPTIDADPLQMRQLFQNLIGNGLKFHQPGKQPEIAITAEFIQGDKNGQAAVELKVHDNGIGFDEKYLEQIFKPFHRLHSREEYAGTGMGLAICRKIVDRHNGVITAKSQLGLGATFSITIPVHQTTEDTTDHKLILPGKAVST